jgi:hypothetical protein
VNEQSTLKNRIGRWFRGFKPVHTELPLQRDNGNGDDAHTHPEMQITRGSFLRPWAKRDAAIANLQHGFETLTDLMGAVRDNLEHQNRRQDELMGYLSHLPDALQLIPESNRAAGETLKAIHQQISYQNQQQSRLGTILEKISEATSEHGKSLHNIGERAEMLEQHDQMISQNLQSVGVAMQSVSRNTDTSTQVLQTLRENLQSRDGQLERVLRKQNVRFTTMLSIAIFLSIAALAAVVIMGWMMLKTAKSAANASPAPTPTVDVSPIR